MLSNGTFPLVKTGIAGSLTRIIRSVKTLPTLRKQGTVICRHGKSIICLVQPVIWKHVGGCRFGSRNTGINWPDPVIMLRALKIIPAPLRLPASAAPCRSSATTGGCTPPTGTRCSGCSSTPARCTARSSGSAKGSWTKPVQVNVRARQQTETKVGGLLGERSALRNRSPECFFNSDSYKWCVDLTGRSSCSFCHFFISLLLQSSWFFVLFSQCVTVTNYFWSRSAIFCCSICLM